jgi:hypothetical protein
VRRLITVLRGELDDGRRVEVAFIGPGHYRIRAVPTGCLDVATLLGQRCADPAAVGWCCDRLGHPHPDPADLAWLESQLDKGSTPGVGSADA